MKFGYKIILLLSFILFFRCTTGPEFERENPYDRDASSDTLGLKQFPESLIDKYQFTSEGLNINIYQNTPAESFFGTKIKILRKNGNSPFEEIGIYNFKSSRDSDFISEFFIDKSINDYTDIGYPLIYKIVNDRNISREIEINFGLIENLRSTEVEEQIIIQWDDSVFMNNGFQVFQKTGDQISEYEEIIVPETSFQIEPTISNLSSQFFIVPYKNYAGEKTFLDSTLYYFTPSPPTDLNFEIVASDQIKLTWKDNSINETGYRVRNMLTNEVYEVEANRNNFTITDEIEISDQKSFEVYSILNELSSEPSKLEFTVPDFPYPKILGIEHLTESSFRILFEDRVSFERDVYFDTGVLNFKTSGKNGFIDIETSGEYEGWNLSLRADLSYGRYGSRSMEIANRPTLEKITTISSGNSTTAKVIDVRTIGNTLLYSSGQSIFSIGLESLQEINLMSFPEEITLLRMSNDNGSAFVSTGASNYLIDVLNGSILVEIPNLPETIFDASFISEDSKILLSTNNGLIIYTISDEQTSGISGFEAGLEYEFIGDATQTRLLAFERNESVVYYFNTLSNFEYHNKADLSTAYSTRPPEITNISHFSTSNNTAGYESGGGIEFWVDTDECFAPSYVCVYPIYDIYERDRNSYFQIIDIKYRIVSSENYLRLVGKESSRNNIHVIERESGNITMQKINFDSNILVEFDEELNEFRFYDISKEWRFTNYGVYEDIVRPEN